MLLSLYTKESNYFGKGQAPCKYENGRTEMVKDNIKVLMDV